MKDKEIKEVAIKKVSNGYTVELFDNNYHGTTTVFFTLEETIKFIQRKLEEVEG